MNEQNIGKSLQKSTEILPHPQHIIETVVTVTSNSGQLHEDGNKIVENYIL